MQAEQAHASGAHQVCLVTRCGSGGNGGGRCEGGGEGGSTSFNPTVQASVEGFAKNVGHRAGHWAVTVDGARNFRA